MVRILSDEAIAELLSLPDLLPVVEEALLAQYRGTVERPDRPHFPVGVGLAGEEPMGTGLVMPAAIHGADHYATKLASVHDDNPERGLPTVNAQIALTEAATGLPAAYMAGTRITSARTGCIGGLAARELADEPLTVGVLGAGTQARWQTRAIDAASTVDDVRIYSPSDSKSACAADLREDGIDARAVDSPRAAVEGATVVVTATTSAEPTFPADALADGTLLIAVGAYTGEMQEVPAAAIERAETVFADVPSEVAEIGDVRESDLDADELVPLGAVLAGDAGRRTDDGIVVVESVGTAVLDAATAEHIYLVAAETGAGIDIDL